MDSRKDRLDVALRPAEIVQIWYNARRTSPKIPCSSQASHLEFGRGSLKDAASRSVAHIRWYCTLASTSSDLPRCSFVRCVQEMGKLTSSTNNSVKLRISSLLLNQQPSHVPCSCYASAAKRAKQGHSLPMLDRVFPAPLGNLLRQIVPPGYSLIGRSAEKGENVE